MCNLSTPTIAPAVLDHDAYDGALFPVRPDCRVVGIQRDKLKDFLTVLIDATRSVLFKSTFNSVGEAAAALGYDKIAGLRTERWINDDRVALQKYRLH